MLHRTFCFALGWVLAACASAPARHLSLAEALKEPPVRPTPAASKVHDAALHAELFAFSDASEAERVKAMKGSPMPEVEAERWTEVLGAVDAFLAQPLEPGTPFDAARARLVLQAELTADGQTYGDVPKALAFRVSNELQALSSKVAIAAERLRVQPKRFLWPVAPVVVTSPYGTRVHPLTGDTQFHAGTDLLADAAQPVHAAYDGVVVFAGWHGGYGKQIELQHDAHVSTRYGHLQTWLVDSGTRVHKGQVIGLAGSTGLSTGVHVHFEVRRDGVPLDPEAELLPSSQPPLVAGR